jgi:hypothetical protein
MLTVKKQFILGQNDEPIAVVLDINTFREIEELLEDLDDVQVIESRRSEPVYDWEEIKETL